MIIWEFDVLLGSKLNMSTDEGIVSLSLAWTRARGSARAAIVDDACLFVSSDDFGDAAVSDADRSCSNRQSTSHSIDGHSRAMAILRAPLACISRMRRRSQASNGRPLI